MRVELAIRRLCLDLKYDPNQPRVPAGSAEGGRWASGQSSDPSIDGELIRIAQGRRVFTPINLAQEDARGGHAFRDHVAKTDDELIAEVQAETVRVPFLLDAGLAAEGSFVSPESANNLVNRTLEQYPSTVDFVASGTLDEAVLKKRFGYPTGKEAFRPDLDTRPYIRPTYSVIVVIRHSGKLPNGFRVHTAYPSNDRAGK